MSIKLYRLLILLVDIKKLITKYIKKFYYQ